MKTLDEVILKKSSKTFRVNDVCAFLGITPRVLKHYEEKGHTPSRQNGRERLPRLFRRGDNENPDGGKSEKDGAFHERNTAVLFGENRPERVARTTYRSAGYDKQPSESGRSGNADRKTQV